MFWLLVLSSEVRVNDLVGLDFCALFHFNLQHHAVQIVGMGCFFASCFWFASACYSPP